MIDGEDYKVDNNSLDALMLRKMFLTGAKNLEIKKNWINELNVFPVPDGDTGTNMTLTIMSAANEINKLKDPTIDELAKAISSGSLRGARGNSGVILSQLFRGFTKGIRDQKEIGADILALAMDKAVETAYKAVMKPKEGTILTVAKAMAQKADELAPEAKNLGMLFDEILKAGDETLARTPEMLPVLKEAGVVDSGGQGLMTILHGAVDAFNGVEIELSFEVPSSEKTAETVAAEKLLYAYCTEFIIHQEKPFSGNEEDSLKEYFLKIGEKAVIQAADDTIKCHLHTNDPGMAIQKGLEFGFLTNIKIENMNNPFEEKLFTEGEISAAQNKKEACSGIAPETPKKKMAFISVTIGEGLSEIFRQLGVDVLIEGGQTMNPSTEDMLDAIKKAHAENVFILPNNKNVILAANQAKALVEDTNIFVIPTKTVPQGITAVINFVPENTPEENAEAMTDGIQYVKTGEVTYAVRDTRVEGHEIHSGDIMGIGDDGILAVGTDVKRVTLDMLEKIVDEESELISIYNGESFSTDETSKLVEMVKGKFPGLDVEMNYGGQPVYYCILSVE